MPNVALQRFAVMFNFVKATTRRRQHYIVLTKLGRLPSPIRLKSSRDIAFFLPRCFALPPCLPRAPALAALITAVASVPAYARFFAPSISATSLMILQRD